MCAAHLDSVVVPLEEVFMRGNRSRADAAKELQALLAETTTTTAKEDFVAHIRNELILTTARKLGCVATLSLCCESDRLQHLEGAPR